MPGKRGFASMSKEKRTAIARLGGHGVAKEKRSFSKDRQLAMTAGSLGGQKSAEVRRALAAARREANKND